MQDKVLVSNFDLSVRHTSDVCCAEYKDHSTYCRVDITPDMVKQMYDHYKEQGKYDEPPRDSTK